VSAVHAARVAPTVVALRTKAAKVVDAELARLAGRLPADPARWMKWKRGPCAGVVDKLLHAPTVRVKELAGSPGGDAYEARWRVLVRSRPRRRRRGSRWPTPIPAPPAQPDSASGTRGLREDT